MTEKNYMKQKHLSYYKEIIEDLREELAKAIKENDYLKFRIKELEEIDKSHQELVGELLRGKQNEKNRK